MRRLSDTVSPSRTAGLAQGKGRPQETVFFSFLFFSFLFFLFFSFRFFSFLFFSFRFFSFLFFSFLFFSFPSFSFYFLFFSVLPLSKTSREVGLSFRFSTWARSDDGEGGGVDGGIGGEEDCSLGRAIGDGASSRFGRASFRGRWTFVVGARFGVLFLGSRLDLVFKEKM